MATQSPFSVLSNVISSLGKGVSAPSWMVQEIQRRMVLTVNHVLQQEPLAQERLATQQGKVIYVSWRQFNGQVRITPAGLLDLDDSSGPGDLLLEVSEKSVGRLARNVVEGSRPAIRIAGDVELAGRINWVIDNVRWDLEEDLARLIGDVPAYHLTRVGSRVAEELRRFVNATVSTVDSVAAGMRRRQHDSDSPAAAPAAPVPPVSPVPPDSVRSETAGTGTGNDSPSSGATQREG